MAKTVKFLLKSERSSNNPLASNNKNVAGRASGSSAVDMNSAIVVKGALLGGWVGEDGALVGFCVSGTGGPEGAVDSNIVGDCVVGTAGEFGSKLFCDVGEGTCAKSRSSFGLPLLLLELLVTITTATTTPIIMSSKVAPQT